MGMGEGSVEVNTLEQRVNFDGSLCSGEGILGTRVGGDILVLELLDVTFTQDC